MPKALTNALLVLAILLLSVSAIAGDQLLRWGVARAARGPAGPSRETVVPLAAQAMPVALLGPAVAIGAFHLLDRRAPVAR